MPAHVMTHTVRLQELLSGIMVLRPDQDVQVRGLSLASGNIQPGEVFCACAGTHAHGLDYVQEAFTRGCCAVLCEPRADISDKLTALAREAPVPVIALTDLTQKLGVIAERFYDAPSARMHVVGITGTNGKTSCSHFLAQALHKDAPCGVIGTLGNGLVGQLAHASHTTPDAITVHRLLRDFAQAGAQATVMEVSSHGLVQGRVSGVNIDVAVFTNLSHDHLDYHGDMQAYGAAKRLLFEKSGLKAAVINAEDAMGEQLIRSLSDRLRVLSYSTTKAVSADLNADCITQSPAGLQFELSSSWGRAQVRSPLLGRFNVSNLLAVLGALLALGIEFEDAVQRIERLTTVNGRMQRVAAPGEFQSNAPLVVVDYAHTPDALDKSLQSLREHLNVANGGKSKLWCVFGCGGDRDKAKRAPMGAVAELRADYTVVTNDNPRREDPGSIIDDILAGVVDRRRVTVISDRVAAIGNAIQSAAATDAILIAGKGHETYQIFGLQKRPYPGDAAVALNALAKRHILGESS